MTHQNIHILGASGSGTTTLAQKLSKRLDYHHFDSDDYLWKITDPPFQKKRCKSLRQALLKKDLEENSSWILSGSLCGWGDIFMSYFDLVIYLWIPENERIKRLKKREKERYGKRILSGGDMHETYTDFIAYAANYEQGGMDIRSRKLHDQWLSKLTCPVIRLEGLLSIDEKTERIIKILNEKNI